MARRRVGASLRVLCTGPEGSGTYLMTRLVSQMGATAYHLSFPSEGRWPSVRAFLDGNRRVRRFDVALVMTRDWWATSQSQVGQGHQTTPQDAFVNLPRAYWEIITQLQEVERPWRMVSYESLVRRPRLVLANVAEWLGLEFPEGHERIYDANTKY